MMSKSAESVSTGQRLIFIAGFSLAVLGAGFLFSRAVQAQDSVEPVIEERAPLSAAELEALVGPIALYPDALVSIVLPASTYPLQIVQAGRYLKDHETDPTLKPDEDWDDSVLALLNYPEVVELMNADLDWTRTLGEAAVYQQAELMDAIQTFRDRAYAAGNLKSDERQVVTRTEEVIIIEPANPTVIYVPDYEPEVVVVRHVYPVYRYYPRPYPVYYYPYPHGYTFGHGLFWGLTLAFAIDWHAHHVHVHHHKHRAHPYHGRSYHYPYYRRHMRRAHYRDHIWRPQHDHRSRHRHAAARLKANRRVDAALNGRKPHRKHAERRFHESGPRNVTPAKKHDRFHHRRDKAAFGAREGARHKNKARPDSRKGARHFDAVPGTKRAGRKTAATPRELRRSNRKHASARIRSDSFQHRREKRAHVSKRRAHSSIAARVSPSARHGNRGNVSRGTRSFAGAANNSRPRLRSNPGKRMSPGMRSGARNRAGFSARSHAGGRSGFGGRSHRQVR